MCRLSCELCVGGPAAWGCSWSSASFLGVRRWYIGGRRLVRRVGVPVVRRRVAGRRVVGRVSRVQYVSFAAKEAAFFTWVAWGA